jgi:hypothetical protein
MPRDDKMRKRHGYNLINIKKKIDELSYRDERKKSLSKNVDNKQRSSLKVPLITEKHIRKGGG